MSNASMIPVSGSLQRYCGLVLCFALIIGGGTVQGLWTTHLLQVLLLPIVFAGLSGMTLATIGWLQRLILLLVVALIGLQFVPSENVYPAALDMPSDVGFWATAPQRALEASLFIIAIVPMFLVVQRMNSKQQERLLPYVFVGVGINLIVAVFHAASGEVFGPGLPLPFKLLGGLFANPNHFAALLYAAVPMLALILLHERGNKVGYVAVVVIILLFQMSIGSTAGIGITVLLSLFSFIVFLNGAKRLSPFMVLGFVLVLVAGMAAIAVRDAQFMDVSDRSEFVINTLAAIRDTLPFGTGLGSFIDVYPSYEAIDTVAAEFTNHAHNDYLEVVLEGGVITAAILTLYAVMLFTTRPATPMQRAALLSILALLVHSAVDYPLRTMAIALLFAVLNGMLFSVKTPAKPTVRTVKADPKPAPKPETDDTPKTDD